MKYNQIINGLITLLLSSTAMAGGPMIDTDKLNPVNPVQKQQLKQKSQTKTQQKAIKRITKAEVRPLRATHSGRPTRSWCEAHDSSTIEGRVDLYYNFPGPPGGRQLPGVMVVNSNGREYRTDITVYPGTNKLTISDRLEFRTQDACPPNRVGVRLMARNPEDKTLFMPVIIYAGPDRWDNPTWY